MRQYHPSSLMRRMKMHRLSASLHKRISAEVTGRPGDSTLMQDRMRDESHRDVQAAYRDDDLELLTAYGMFVSPTHGTVHVRLAVGAARRMNRHADLTVDLTPEMVSITGKVCEVTRDVSNPGYWGTQESIVALLAAVMAYPESEYALLDLVQKRGVPLRERDMEELIAEVVSNEETSPDAYF